MFSKNKEEQKKYQNIITQKLRELLGEYEVDILTEYVWHMAGNAKSSSEFMCNELKDFLGDHTTVFVNWLMKLMNDIKKQKKINEISSKSEKTHKSGYTKDKQYDELSKSNKSRESRTRQSIMHSKKTKGYLKENDTNKKDFSSYRKRSRSLLSRSSKYSNEDASFSRRKSKKRQKRGLSSRSSSTSSNTRKFHYDKNKIKTKKTDRSKEVDKIKLKEKYKKGDRSTSSSFSPSRVIYVEKEEDKKEKKNEMFLDNLLNKSELELKRKNDSSDEYNTNEKKNKAILKPNPRFVGDNSVSFMQPPAPSVNNPDISSYNMNYTFDNMNMQNYEKEINSVGNYYQGNYMMAQQNALDNTYLSSNVNNNFFNTRYSNNIQQKNINIKMNMNKNVPQTNYMNTNRLNNNNYLYQKNNLMNVNVPNVSGNEKISVPNYSKHNTSNIRNHPNYYANTNNKNDFMDNKQNQHQYYMPKVNKQQFFIQTPINSERNVKSQQPSMAQIKNKNFPSQKNTPNIAFNNDNNNNASIQSNVQSNIESSQTQQNNAQVEEEKAQSVSKMNERGNQVANTESTTNPNVIIKIQKKCLFLPNCQYGEKCRYIHPIENCRNWPYCAFGSECIYIHPDVPCKFGIYCCNYYCNYSHNHVNSSALPEVGINGYFLNKKLVNNYDKNSNANFDDKVAQISISMPKTPPEMRKDKSKSEYNENEYIQNILETEKDELREQRNESMENKENVNETTGEQKEEREYEVEDLDKEGEENILQNNNNCQNHYTNDNTGNEFNSNIKNNENESINYNCFEIVIDPDNFKEKKLTNEEKIKESHNKTENNYETNDMDNKVFTIEDSS